MNEAPSRRITLADVAVYRRFGGDLDGYVRTACPEPRVPDDVWIAIDTLRQRLRITALGLDAPGYAADLEADFDSWAADDAARAALRALSSNRPHLGHSPALFETVIARQKKEQS